MAATRTKIRRAALYDRVSRDRLGQGHSVQQQETENRQACEANGWEVESVYTDNDRSASRYARKLRDDWERLTHDLEAGRFDVLVLWEPSRGSRDLKVWATLLDACREHGVQIHVTSHERTYDPADARDFRSLAGDAVDSVYEADQTSSRVRRDTRHRAARGRPHGFVAYGWRREYEHGSDGRVTGSHDVLDVAQADVIREGTRRALAGESLRAVAKSLNDRGIPGPRGGEWNSITLRQVLKRERNAGLCVHQGSVVGRGTWPAIVTEREHARLIRLLANPARAPRRGPSVKYLLSGIARCGACEESALRVLVQRSTGALCYTCPRCFGVRRDLGRVDRLVTEVVTGRLAQPDVLQLLAQPSADLGPLVEQRDALRDKLNAITADYDDDVITRTQFVELTQRTRAKLEKVTQQLARAAGAVDVTDLARPDIAEVWDDVPLERRRAVIDALINVTVLPVGSGTRWDPRSVKIEWKR